MTVAAIRYEVEYPESDGQPMGESDLHRQEMMDLIAALKREFAKADDVYVSGNLFLYYAEGNPQVVICPDVFVVKGVHPGLRRTYKLWEEGQAPCFVIEVTSESSRREDLKKKDTYAALGVEEYFLHDPLGEYLSPPLQGFRLVKGKYQRIPAARDGSLESSVLGLTLHQEGSQLRLLKRGTGQSLLRIEEVSELAAAEGKRAEAERKRAEAERKRAEAAEAEIARLKARLAALE